MPRRPPHTCANLRLLGIDGPGGAAEQVAAPADWIVPVPDDADLRRLAFAEPLAVAVRAVRRAGLAIGEEVTVAGVGPIGLAVATCARLAGAGRVLGIGRGGHGQHRRPAPAGAAVRARHERPPGPGGPLGPGMQRALDVSFSLSSSWASWDGAPGPAGQGRGRPDPAGHRLPPGSLAGRFRRNPGPKRRQGAARPATRSRERSRP